MGKYLISASYTPEGTKGLLKEGGSGRAAQIENIMTSLGGKMEAFYYAFGKDDVYVIVEVPNPESAMALSLATNATGMVKIRITPLLETKEVDEACKNFHQIPRPRSITEKINQLLVIKKH